MRQRNMVEIESETAPLASHRFQTESIFHLIFIGNLFDENLKLKFVFKKLAYSHEGFECMIYGWLIFHFMLILLGTAQMGIWYNIMC